MHRTRLLIIGAGGHGRDIVWLARDCAIFDVVGLLDDTLSPGTLIAETSVLGSIADWHMFAEEAELVIAVGAPRARRAIDRLVRSSAPNGRQPRYASLIHPSVIRSEPCQIGAGSMICAGAILASNVRLGAHTIVNIGCTVGHDVQTAGFCTLAPRAVVSGNVILEEAVEIGAGAVVREKTRFGVGSMAAMGAVVMKDVPAFAMVLGNPARPLQELDPLA
ncbi:MAG: acetyltransferase [Burkholderiaceae bacterium]|jgi:sugar O-acyltransferase (sialic acid O-acetyltransferase NeuD family)